VTLLLDDHGFAGARELVERKRAGERAVLDMESRTRWMAELERAFEVLEAAFIASTLPDESPNRGELEGWLLEVRRRYFE
jgi:hypothetical protein